MSLYQSDAFREGGDRATFTWAVRLERWNGDSYAEVYVYDNLDAGKWLITVPFADTLVALRTDTPQPHGWAVAEVRFYDNTRCEDPPLEGMAMSTP